MSLTVLTIEVANPKNEDVREPIEFLIDSGAVYSFAPREILTRLGIRSHSRQRFRLADGSSIERDGLVLDAVRRELLPLPMVVGGSIDHAGLD